jgi:hypothetical protein
MLGAPGAVRNHLKQKPVSAAVKTAHALGAESFEEWLATLTESNSAKTESIAPLLKIPPTSMRIFEGPMEKKAIGHLGIAWQGRYAILTDYHLGFAKRLDMHSAEAMLWMHTKELPTSVTELQDVFDKADFNGNGLLDLEEAKASLIALNLYSNDQDVQILFEALDVDSSGTLSWEEFQDLAKKAHAANHVVDYIPLVEIMEVKAEIVSKCPGSDSRSIKSRATESQPSDSNTLDNNDVQKSNRRMESFFRSCLVQLEAATGLDLNGDGMTATDSQKSST